MRPETKAKLDLMAELLEQAAAVQARADQLKWEVLDSEERGTHTAVAEVLGVTRQAVAKMVAERRRKEMQGDGGQPS